LALSALINMTTFCTSAVATFAVLGFWACAAYTGTAAITKTATINFGFMEISRICIGSTMLSGPAEIPAKHFCKKNGS
jgi:hypothetical protein